MRKTVIPLALLVGALAIGSQMGQFINHYRVRFSNARLNMTETQRAFFAKVFFNVNLELINPSLLSGELKAVNVQILFENKLLGTVRQSSATKIASKETTTIPLLVGLPTLSIYNSISSAMAMLLGGKPLNLKLVGDVLTDIGNIKVDQQITIA